MTPSCNIWLRIMLRRRAGVAQPSVAGWEFRLRTAPIGGCTTDGRATARWLRPDFVRIRIFVATSIAGTTAVATIAPIRRGVRDIAEPQRPGGSLPPTRCQR